MYAEQLNLQAHENTPNDFYQRKTENYQMKANKETQQDEK